VERADKEPANPALTVAYDAYRIMYNLHNKNLIAIFLCSLTLYHHRNKERLPITKYVYSLSYPFMIKLMTTLLKDIPDILTKFKIV